MTGACSWDVPGADRYTGTVPTAIRAYGLPLTTQSALTEAFKRREFTDAIVIDRDSIRGVAHDYAPDIRSMHFGSRGRICGTVTRAGWSALHTETALVLCADDECIAWPAVCGNVFRLTRLARANPVGVGPVVDVGVHDAPLTFSEPQTPAAAMPGLLPNAGTSGLSGSSGFNAWSDFVPAQLVPVFVPFAPVAAVPEPGIWALMVAGLAALAIWRRRL